MSHFKCSLSVDDQQHTLESDSTHSSAHIKTTLTPHEFGERLVITLHPQEAVIIDDVTLKISHKVSRSCSMTFNGYQSWTDTQPLFPYDKMPYLSPLAQQLVAKYQFDKYGDTLIYPFKHGRGHFHGFTYVSLKEQDQSILLASLDESSGFTMFEYDHRRGLWTIRKDNQGIQCTQPTVLLDVILLKGYESTLFDSYAQLMKLSLKTTQIHTGWTSWYYHYQDINESIILNNIEALASSKAQLDIIQIDDGYQTAIGDWLSVDFNKFPQGMAYLATKIQEKGFKAGIWLAPCVCQVDSKLVNDHPDWLLKDEFGEFRMGGGNWGGFYILDMQKEEVKEYLRHVFHVVLDVWNYDMVKLDFLYAACLYPTLTKTRGQLMHETMAFIRSCVKEKLILGCGVPLGSAFGFVDFCRIGCDVGLDWNDKWYMKLFHRERISTYHAINNAIGRYPLHNRFFLNDPDVFILREESNQLTSVQKNTLAQTNKLTHGLLFTSDDVSKYSDSLKETFKKLMQHDNLVIHKIECLKKGVYKISFSNHYKPNIQWVNTSSKAYRNKEIQLAPFETVIKEEL
ncbi:MAG: alpha-galactosidase [Erysipelothrix sp.]|nr:alpha-galactosidase [Erysipelothrix sp.]